MEERTNSKIEVFYDGRCPMCASLMGRVERSSKRSQFDLRDIETTVRTVQAITQRVQQEAAEEAAAGSVRDR